MQYRRDANANAHRWAANANANRWAANANTAGLLTLTAGLLALTAGLLMLTPALTHQQDSHLPLAGLGRPPGAAPGPGATGCLGRTSWSRRSTSGPRTRRRSGRSRSPRSARPPTCEQSENFCHHILKAEVKGQGASSRDQDQRGRGRGSDLLPGEEMSCKSPNSDRPASTDA